MRKGRGKPAKKVKEYEPDVAEIILDIVTEDPEEKHISPQMQEISVKEHCADESIWKGE